MEPVTATCRIPTRAYRIVGGGATVMYGTEREILRYLRKNGIDDVTPLEVDRLRLGVRFTPTLLVYDRFGTVTGAWVGRLVAEREQQVRAALATLSDHSQAK